MKKTILLFCIIISSLFLLSGCKIETVKQHGEKNEDALKEKMAVSLEIKCSTILDNLDKADKEVKDILPDDGVLLVLQEFEVSHGSSVYDLLIFASKEKSFVTVATGSNKTAYITSIADIKEFSVGASSGWKYTVNGEFVAQSCGAYELKAGDKVAFLFTCDLGEDIK